MIDLASVPKSFFIVHMNLAREPSHPEGSASDSYSAVLPLRDDGRLDEQVWRAHPDLCRVSHMDAHGVMRTGALIRVSGEGAWLFDFGQGSEPESGFRFESEHFRPGEYVSVIRDGEEHTYRIVSLRPVKG